MDCVEVFYDQNIQEFFDDIIESDNEEVSIVNGNRTHNSQEIFDSDDEVPAAEVISEVSHPRGVSKILRSHQKYLLALYRAYFYYRKHAIPQSLFNFRGNRNSKNY